MFDFENAKIGILGLGYVGLPLSVAFGANRTTFGFDTNGSRIKELCKGVDTTLEIDSSELKETPFLEFHDDAQALKDCNVYIVTVPTPIDKHKKPDLSAIIAASRTVGGLIQKGDVVVYESTVYPGATEEDCVPVLEQVSSLVFNEDFFVGYSPERINPGDKEHRLTDIKKITSGSTPECAKFVDQLYNSIIAAGTHLAPTIRVAEAAKVIENTQRDVNIALINELAVIFEKLGIETQDVLEAAGTKWNFLPFKPGLVGGHCIGVDPHYLTHRVQAEGYHPEIILAGRRINDEMGSWVAAQLIKGMIKKNIQIQGAKVLIMGLTFKENCPDLRNTRVVDVISELTEYGVDICVFDPWVEQREADKVLGLSMTTEPKVGGYSAVLLAVAHSVFLETNPETIRSFCGEDGIVYDLKNLLPRQFTDLRL